MYSLDPSLQSYALPTFNPKTAGTSANPYLACLIDPANNPCRIPDEYSNQTALYCSRSFYDVYGNTAVGTPTADIGKFSCIVRPVIGLSPISQLNCQFSSFSPTSVWPSLDFSQATSYNLHADVNIGPLVGTNGNNGLVREIRPVAMSAWFQYTAPSITLGGHVACALTDGNVYNYYSTSLDSMAGIPLQEYRMLSTLPNSYNGKIIDGCYAFYKPFDAEDISFQNAYQPSVTVNDYGVQHTYPAIVISGQVMSTSGTYSGVIGRIQVDIVFEYVTFSRLVESIPSPVDVPLLWNARQALQNVRTCMSNDEHESFFRKVLNGAKILLGKVAPVAGTAIGGMIGGPGGAALGRTLGNAVSGVVNRKPNQQSSNGSNAGNSNGRKKRKKIRKPIKKLTRLISN